MIKFKLVSEIQKWKAASDNIVIGIDMNTDVRTSKLAKIFQSLDLRDGIISTHPSKSPPATFNQNGSRIPIDAIWAFR